MAAAARSGLLLAGRPVFPRQAVVARRAATVSAPLPTSTTSTMMFSPPTTRGPVLARTASLAASMARVPGLVVRCQGAHEAPQGPPRWQVANTLTGTPSSSSSRSLRPKLGEPATLRRGYVTPTRIACGDAGDTLHPPPPPKPPAPGKAPVVQKALATRIMGMAPEVVVRAVKGAIQFSVEMAHGVKYLYVETREGFRIRQRARQSGEHLHYREVLLLERNPEDLARFLPFVVVSLLPFAAIYLPIIISAFPKFLPSTFLTEAQKREQQRAQMLRRRRGTVVLEQFYNEVCGPSRVRRRSDARLDVTTLAREIAAADDDAPIGLDDMPPEVLRAAARTLAVNSYWPPFRSLRVKKLRKRLWRLQRLDETVFADRALLEEVLTADEVQHFLHERGLTTAFAPRPTEHRTIRRWVMLSAHHEFRPTHYLMWMVRAFQLMDDPPTREAELAAAADVVRSAIESGGSGSGNGAAGDGGRGGRRHARDDD